MRKKRKGIKNINKNKTNKIKILLVFFIAVFLISCILFIFILTFTDFFKGLLTLGEKPVPGKGKLYTGPTGELLAYYTFDNNVNDASGHGNDGDIFGAVFVNGKIDKALSFDGIDDYVNLSSVNFPYGTGPKTICAWAKANSVSEGEHLIVSYGNESQENAFFIGRNRTSLFAGGYESDIFYPDYWAFGVWNHLCIVYNGTHAILYSNGSYLISYPKSLDIIRNKAYIGKQINSLNQYWDGEIDELKIWNYALSSEEINQEYQIIEQPPEIISLSPSSGYSNPNQEINFIATYSDLDSWNDIEYGDIRIKNKLDNQTYFWLKYFPNSSSIYLLNESSTLGSCSSGSSIILENNYLKLACSRTNFSSLGIILSLNFAIIFKDESLGKSFDIYLQAKDFKNNFSELLDMGDWIVNYTSPQNNIPAVGEIIPSSGESAVNQEIIFTTGYSDSDGFNDIEYGIFIINKNLTEKPYNFFAYYLNNDNLSLTKDDNNSLLIGTCKIGSYNVLENSYAKIDCSRSNASKSGNSIFVNWSITFKSQSQGKNYKMYLSAKDTKENSSEILYRGEWWVSGITNISNCTDSDDGKDYYKKGNATGSNGNYTDYCFNNSNNLREFFCLANHAVDVNEFFCSDGCEDGKCKRAPPAPLDITPPDIIPPETTITPQDGKETTTISSEAREKLGIVLFWTLIVIIAFSIIAILILIYINISKKRNLKNQLPSPIIRYPSNPNRFPGFYPQRK